MWVVGGSHFGAPQVESCPFLLYAHQLRAWASARPSLSLVWSPAKWGCVSCIRGRVKMWKGGESVKCQAETVSSCHLPSVPRPKGQGQGRPPLCPAAAPAPVWGGPGPSVVSACDGEPAGNLPFPCPSPTSLSQAPRRRNPQETNPGVTTQTQINWVQSLSSVWLFETPWIAARQASLSITKSQSSLRFISIESVMPSSHLILCCPLLLLPPIPPSIRVFSNESTLLMRRPKY